MISSLHYQKIMNAVYCVAIFVVALCISSITPPLQSPDEPAHLGRAYLLSKGQIILDSPQGQPSGGFIDVGLVNYVQTFSLLAGKLDKRWSAEEQDFANSIHWNHSKAFSSISGTGFYFPAIYLPQATGLLIGEQLDFSIDTSYKLARLLALLCTCMILFAAFRVHQPPILVYLLLALPMALFQSGSASLDGLSNALAVLCISIFLRIAREPESSKPWLFYLLATSCFILASCRAHLLPFLALPFAAWVLQRQLRFLIPAIVCSLLTVGWTMLAMKTTVHVAVNSGQLTSFYLLRPLLFLKIIANTLAESHTINFYGQSFLGVLGWLDAYFSKQFYLLMKILLLLGAAAGFMAWQGPRAKLAALSLVMLSVASVMLIFFALLTTWTPHPATIIQGVQGRYFFVPIILLAYALTPNLRYTNRWQVGLATGLIVIFMALVAANTLSLLVVRYFQTVEEQPLFSVTMRPSSALSATTNIPLYLTSSQQRYSLPLRRISILFGTYVRNNPGIALLTLTTKTGEQHEYPLDLIQLADNRYHTVEIKPLPYVSGSIRYQTGGGVSTWEVHRDDGRVLTCLIYEGTNGFKRGTPSCPTN